MKRPPAGREGWKHKSVFETYLLMGPGRNLRALSENVNISYETIRDWSRKWKWQERVIVRDNRALSTLEAENDLVLKDTILRRHQEAYQAVQEKALEYLTKKRSSFSNSKSPAKDAAIALDVGIKGERDVLGLRNTKLKGAIVKEGLAAMVEMVMNS